jgi:hypothetical protein
MHVPFSEGWVTLYYTHYFGQWENFLTFSDWPRTDEGALAGCCRLARKGMSLHPLLFTAFYLAVLLNWNFRPNERLFSPSFRFYWLDCPWS